MSNPINKFDEMKWNCFWREKSNPILSQIISNELNVKLQDLEKPNDIMFSIITTYEKELKLY
jgi:hypothetical protein